MLMVVLLLEQIKKVPLLVLLFRWAPVVAVETSVSHFRPCEQALGAPELSLQDHALLVDHHGRPLGSLELKRETYLSLPNPPPTFLNLVFMPIFLLKPHLSPKALEHRTEFDVLKASLKQFLTRPLPFSLLRYEESAIIFWNSRPAVGALLDVLSKMRLGGEGILLNPVEATYTHSELKTIKHTFLWCFSSAMEAMQGVRQNALDDDHIGIELEKTLLSILEHLIRSQILQKQDVKNLFREKLIWSELSYLIVEATPDLSRLGLDIQSSLRSSPDFNVFHGIFMIMESEHWRHLIHPILSQKYRDFPGVSNDREWKTWHKIRALKPLDRLMKKFFQPGFPDALLSDSPTWKKTYGAYRLAQQLCVLLNGPLYPEVVLSPDSTFRYYAFICEALSYIFFHLTGGSPGHHLLRRLQEGGSLRFNFVSSLLQLVHNTQPSKTIVRPGPGGEANNHAWTPCTYDTIQENLTRLRDFETSEMPSGRLVKQEKWKTEPGIQTLVNLARNNLQKAEEQLNEELRKRSIRPFH